MEEVIDEKRKEKRGFSHGKKRKSKKRRKGWVRIPCFQLSCFGSNATDDGVIVVEELKGEEARKKRRHLIFWMRKPERTVPVNGVGQTDEIEIDQMLDGGNLLQTEVEAVKKPLRSTVDGDVEESKFRRLFYIFSPKAHRKKTSNSIKNGSYPQLQKFQVISGTQTSMETTTSPRSVTVTSPKPGFNRSQTTNNLPPSTSKGKQSVSSCPIFSPRGCRKPGRAEDSTDEVSMRSTAEKNTEVVVIRKSDMRIIGFVGGVVLILTTLLGGRGFAIICTSVLLYFAPLLRLPSSPTTELAEETKPKKDDSRIDYDSKVYKKRVIMEGLLERTGRRPAGFLH